MAMEAQDSKNPERAASTPANEAFNDALSTDSKSF